MAQAQDRDAYGGNSTVVDVLGDNPRARILTVLISEAPHDINVTDMARLAGLERKTIYAHLDPLLAYGIVEESRKVGNSKMYQLDTDNEAAKALGRFDDALMHILAEKEEAGQLDDENRPIANES